MGVNQEDSPGDVDAFLAHYGVLGMKWGKRKAKEPSVPRSSKPKKESRRARRSKEKASKQKFYEEKLNRTIQTVTKDPRTLVFLKTAAAQPTIVTGQQFIDYASRGGIFDARYTDVYATIGKSGAYEQNEFINKPYNKFERPDERGGKYVKK